MPMMKPLSIPNALGGVARQDAPAETRTETQTETQKDAAGEEVGYDRIRQPLAQGGFRELTREQFEALPLSERVRLLVSGKLQFFRGGLPVPAHRALRDR